MVYTFDKKEHRYMYAVPTSLDGFWMDFGWRHNITAMYFDKKFFIFRR